MNLQPAAMSIRQQSGTQQLSQVWTDAIGILPDRLQPGRCRQFVFQQLHQSQPATQLLTDAPELFAVETLDDRRIRRA